MLNANISFALELEHSGDMQYKLMCYNLRVIANNSKRINEEKILNNRVLFTYSGQFNKDIVNLLFDLFEIEENFYKLLILNKDNNTFYNYGKLESIFNLKESTETIVKNRISFKVDNQEHKI